MTTNKEIKALYFLHLWKLDKIKCPYFLDGRSYEGSMAILSFEPNLLGHLWPKFIFLAGVGFQSYTIFVFRVWFWILYITRNIQSPLHFKMFAILGHHINICHLRPFFVICGSVWYASWGCLQSFATIPDSREKNQDFYVFGASIKKVFYSIPRYSSLSHWHKKSNVWHKDKFKFI